MLCGVKCGTRPCPAASRLVPGPTTVPRSLRQWPTSSRPSQALTHLSEPGDTRVLAIDLRLALDRPLSALGEYDRSLTLLGEAEALARALDDRARLVWVLAGMASVLRITGNPDGAIEAGEQALALAVELSESALQVQASHYLGQAYYGIGDFARAAALLRRNVEAADRGSGTPDRRAGSSPRRGWRGP